MQNKSPLVWQDARQVLESASQWASHSRPELTRYGTCASGKSLKPILTASRQSASLLMGLPSWSPNFLASFIRPGDDLLFSLELEAADSGTEIYIRDTNPGAKRRDVLQIRIGYASQPRKDKQNNLFVSAEVLNPRLGIGASTPQQPCGIGARLQCPCASRTASLLRRSPR